MRRSTASISERLKKVPPFPPVAVKLLSLLSDPSLDTKEVADLISSDATFTARLLQRANSAGFGSVADPMNVRRVVGRLGLDTTCQITLAQATFAFAQAGLKTETTWRCWQHTVATAVLAEEIAAACNAFSNVAFIAGMLHDVGRLGLLVAYPEEYEQVVRDAAERGQDVLDFEEDEFGANHAEAGRILAERWGLPAEMALIAGHHHDPGEGMEPGLLQIVQVACQLADVLGYAVGQPLVPSSASEVLAPLPGPAQKRLRQAPQQLCGLIEQQLREPGFEATAAPQPEETLTLLAAAIVTDPRKPATRVAEAGPAATAKPFRLSLYVFLLFTLIYLSTWAGHYTSGDGAYKVAWAKAMLLGPPSGTSPGQAGVYSKYGIGHSLLALPPLAIAHFIQEKTGIRSESALYTLMFVINGALFLAMMAYYLAHFYPPRPVWGTAFIMGLATTWWPYTKLDFSEPLVLSIAFLGFIIMRFGNPFLGMLIAGFTLTIRTDSAVILGPIILWYLLANRSVQACVRVGLALVPSIALVLFANYVRYHSIMDHGYAGERFSNPLLVGLYGILFSSGKSVFLFSPPLLLGILGWKHFARRTETASDAWLFLGICAAQILFYAKWWDWSSDDAWGVRFVIPGVLLLCIPMVTVLRRRTVVLPLLAAGIAVQLLAVTVGGLDYLLLLRSTQAQRQALYVGGNNRVDFEDLRFDPHYSQILGNWILLRYLLHMPPHPGNPGDEAKMGTPLGDAIPPQAWTAAAQWDFVWNLHRSATANAASKPAVPSQVQRSFQAH